MSSTLSRSTGIALAVYGLGTAVAFQGSGSPGGDYKDSAVASYVSWGHFWTAAGLWYLGALAALALVVVARGLRDLPRVGPSLAALAQLGAGCGVVGAFVCGGLAVAMAEGGSSVRAGVPHQVAYAITEIGNLLAVCAPALCVGVAAVVLSRLAVLPAWLRLFTLVAGVCGVLAPFFFTYFVYVLWTLVAGLTIALRREAVEPSLAAASLV
jgi:hypothetical protein